MTFPKLLKSCSFRWDSSSRF